MACPRPDVISAASRESLPEDQLHSVYQHLQECSECWQLYLRARSEEPELTVPGYHIIKGLGHGVSSVVYKAWRISNPRELVALKLLWPTNDDQRARFEREIAVLSRLRLPNIVKCLESGRRGDMMYYAMDLIRGEPLDTYFKNRTSGIDEKLEVFERVCRALAGAHAQGVAHRDLKPNNILVDDKGQPHILDFGLCTVDSNEWSTVVYQGRTKPGDVMGTVKYMAPEQAWGGLLDGTIDYRADIWALGIMLYEIATDGSYPYDNGPTDEKTSEEALLHRIRTETPSPPRIASPVHAHDLKRLIDRCLAWDRRQRIQSVTALADDVARCRAQSPIRTRSLPLRYKIQRISLGLAVRRRGLLWLCNVAAVLVFLSAFTRAFDVHWPVSGHDLAKSGLARSIGTANGDIRKNILFIGITDNTFPHVKKYAAKHAFPRVNRQPLSWRTVHGHLMRRLADASPRVVAWDFSFHGVWPTGSAAFVEGVAALHNAGVPVVLAVRRMNKQEIFSDSAIYGPLKDKCHFGIILAHDPEDRSAIAVALRRNETIWPSLALAIFAVVLHPDRQLGIDWRGREKRIELVYQEWDRSDSILRRRDTITLASVSELPRDSRNTGARAGDVLAYRTFALQPPEIWWQNMVAYEDLLRKSDDQLGNTVNGKILVFGEFRRGVDWYNVKYDDGIIHHVPGCFVLADAINGLLSETYLKPVFPFDRLTLFVLAGIAAMGCLLPLPIVRYGRYISPRRNLFLQCVALGSTFACCGAMLGAQRQPWVHISMAGAALFAATLAPFWIEFARAQRRVAPDFKSHPSAGPGRPAETPSCLQLTGR